MMVRAFRRILIIILIPTGMKLSDGKRLVHPTTVENFHFEWENQLYSAFL